MPVGRKFDFQLNGKGFMLVRQLPAGQRSWQRTGSPDSPGRRSQTDVKYGELPDELDHPEVWDDWSAGFGHAYRDPNNPNTFHWSENMDTRFPRQMIHCPQAVVYQRDTVNAASGGELGSFNTDALWFLNVPSTEASSSTRDAPGRGAVLVVGKDYIHSSWAYLNNTSAHFTPRLAEKFGHGLTHAGQPAIFGSFVYIGVAEATGFLRRPMNGNGAEYTHGPLPGRGFVTAGNRMWRLFARDGNTKPNVLLSSVAEGADPMGTLNWSATLSVGNGFEDVQALTQLNEQLYLGLPNGLYVGDQSGSFFNVLPELQYQRHPDNCRDLAIYQGGVVVPHTGGLYWYHPGDFAITREIGPLKLRSNRSPIAGHPRAVAVLGEWLYAGFSTGSISYIMAGRDASPGLPYVWHVQQRLLSPGKISRIFFDTITAASGGGVQSPIRMWAATDASIDLNGTSNYYRWTVPRGGGNPLADPSFTANYYGSARADMGITDWGAPSTTKVFRSFEVEAENLEATSGALSSAWALVYYTIDGGARTLLGTVNISPQQTLYFPSSEGSFVTGNNIEISLESYTKNPWRSPIYRSLVLRGALRPNSVDQVSALVRIGDDVRDRQGGPLRPGAVMLQELRDLAVRRTPVHMVDLAGATQIANVLPPIQEQEIYQQGQKDPEVAAMVKLAVMAFSGG